VGQPELERTEPKASVVVVARDDAATLGQCLDALAEQQVDEPFEVIVVDSFSDDESADVALHHPVVSRVAVSPGARPFAAHNKGAALAASRVVALTDARFAPRPDWLMRGVDAVRSGADIVKGSCDGLPPKSDRPLATASLFVNKRVEERVGLFPAGPDGEEEFFRRAELAGFSIALEPAARVAPAELEPLAELHRPLPQAKAEGNGRRVTNRDAPETFISVVLCTAGRRPEAAERCLRSLEQLEDDRHELIVIDNAPAPRLDRERVQAAGARWVHEPAIGLDRARNRGVAEAVGDIVAFVDDDCEVAPGWLDGLRVPFLDPSVGLVTGRVIPATLSSESQRWFELQYSFDRGPRPSRFTRFDWRPWYPLFPSALGTGCNMAFRRSALDTVGGFDENLDMGSLIGGGGDLDMFARVLDAGYVAAYEPTAVVFHYHRASARALRRQFWDYGMAQGALCFKYAVWRPSLSKQAVRYFLFLLWRQRCRLVSVRKGLEVFPPSLVRLETAGMLCGPPAYLWSRLRR